MRIQSVDFETLEDVPAEVAERWKMRVVLLGEGIAVRAHPMVVEVGDQRAQVLVTLFAEEGGPVGVQGLLPRIPEAGDAVAFGWADGPLFDTGFTFEGTS